MNVAHILTQKGRDVVTARPEDTLQDVAVIMSEKGIGAIVVCNRENEIIGIISERDIMRTIAQLGPRALEDRVASHMTHDVITCDARTTVHSLMERMTLGRFRHMPVVKDGQLDGMVSIGDLIKNRLAEMESEQEELRKYIATA